MPRIAITSIRTKLVSESGSIYYCKRVSITKDSIVMESRLDCYPCFIRIALQASRLSGINENGQKEIIADALDLLKQDIVGKSPLQTACRIQDIVKQHSGCSDPYEHVKHECNNEAEKWLPELRKQVKNASNPLYTAMKAAAIGNIMDYGAFANFDVAALVDQLVDNDFKVNNADELQQQLSVARSITYFADNTGEIYFDSVFIEQLCKNSILERVNLVIRQSPFLNDVSSTEFLPANLKVHPKIKINSLPVIREEQDPEQWNDLTSSDVVISKGMANFENYSEEKNFFFLLISKCDLVSGLISARTKKEVKTGDWILMKS